MSNVPKTVCTVYAALPRAAGDARAFTTRLLGEWGLSHLADTVELLVSELITNAVRHAGGASDPAANLDRPCGEIPPVALAVSLLDTLLIQVWDRSSVPPLRRHAADDEEGGRGLDLVEAMSKEWGCDVLRTGGKIVWSSIETDVHDDQR